MTWWKLQYDKLAVSINPLSLQLMISELFHLSNYSRDYVRALDLFCSEVNYR